MPSNVITFWENVSYTREDYFIGGAEICGEIFQILEKSPWHLREFVREIKSRLQEKECYPDISVFDGKKSREILPKLAELKLKTDRAYMTGCIYYGYKEGKIDVTEQLGLLTFYPCELAAALFLLTAESI